MEVVWAWILEHFGISSSILVIIFASLIQISPIKINPWTAIKNFFVAPVNTAKEIGDIKENVSKLDTKISSVEENTKTIEKLDTQIETLNINVQGLHKNLDIVNTQLNEVHKNLTGVEQRLSAERDERIEEHLEGLRLTILTFGDELQHNGESASREHFNWIMKVIDEYEDYCDTHPDFPNNQCLMTIQYIKDVYRKKFFSVN